MRRPFRFWPFSEHLRHFSGRGYLGERFSSLSRKTAEGEEKSRTAMCRGSGHLNSRHYSQAFFGWPEKVSECIFGLISALYFLLSDLRRDSVFFMGRVHFEVCSEPLFTKEKGSKEIKCMRATKSKQTKKESPPSFSKVQE